jgi:hypothetical protein
LRASSPSPEGTRVKAVQTLILAGRHEVGKPHWPEFDRGGHFAAMEQPELYVGDLRTFVGSLDGRQPVAEERTPADAQTSSIAGVRLFESADFPLIGSVISRSSGRRVPPGSK